MSGRFSIDSSGQLKHLLNEDLPSLSNYYREMSADGGAGVLVVNYYPCGESAQMSAKFLKPNQIGRLARQMGLPTLELEFEQHNRQNQMVVALVTAQTKGVVRVELHEVEIQAAPASPPESQGQTKSAPSSKRKRGSSTTQHKSSKATKQQQDENNQAQT